MSSHLNIGEICDVLFEEIPSDDNSITSCDDSDSDNDYIPPSGELKTKPILFESESSDDESDSENSEILNLDDRNIYLLPSPIKKKKILVVQFFENAYQKQLKLDLGQLHIVNYLPVLKMHL